MAPTTFFWTNPGSGSDESTVSETVASVLPPLSLSSQEPVWAFCALLGATRVHAIPVSEWV